jgi:hypothetical protein
MAKKDDALFVRNGRPNKVVFHYNGVRYPLEHRGNRNDSTSLPADAETDPQVSRWLRNGQLEKISRDAFMKLGTRKVDVLPNEFLKRPVRTGKGVGVEMIAAEADTTRSKTQLNDKDVIGTVRENVTPKWAGDLMSTEEELESMDFSAQQADYPSKHRGDNDNRQRGY